MANPKGNPKIAEYGKLTRFGSERGCSAIEAGKKGNKSQAVRRSYYDVANELVTDEDRMAQIEVLKRMAEKGDLKALELLLKVLKEYENKISVEASMVYEIVIDDEDEAAY